MKVFKIGAIGLAVIVLAVIVLAAFFVLIRPLLYRDYYKRAQKEFPAAGLSDGLVPQGFDRIPAEGLFLRCGYMADGVSPSRIYITDESGDGRFVELYAADGSPYLGHTGGITAGERTVWLANDGEGEDNCVWAIPTESVLDESVTRITLTECFRAEGRAAYCFADGEHLWVGEFYEPGKYETAESHRMISPAGEEHHAIVCAYRIDESKPCGIASAIPGKVLSVTDRVQGFAISPDGAFALSTSYALSNSRLFFHKNVLAEAADEFIEIGGEEVPVWFLDSESLTEELVLPPMSEEIAVADGRLYVQFESASQKYRFGVLTGGLNVYSLPWE